MHTGELQNHLRTLILLFSISGGSPRDRLIEDGSIEERKPDLVRNLSAMRLIEALNGLSRPYQRFQKNFLDVPNIL